MIIELILKKEKNKECKHFSMMQSINGTLKNGNKNKVTKETKKTEKKTRENEYYNQKQKVHFLMYCIIT